MTEATCDAYKAQITTIQTLCNINTTTTADITTAINDLNTIDSQINTDILSMSFPTTVDHLNKFILVQITRSRVSEIQASLLNLIKIRKNHLKTILDPLADMTTPLSYQNDTESLVSYTDNLILNSSGMKDRQLTINES